MTTICLTYFRGRGRAETTRWMLAANDLSFTNIAIDTPEELADLRATGKLPFDQMPLLEIDGLRLSQSSAMIRYLARRGGFYGESDADAVRCDMIAGAVADFAETALQAAFKPSAEIAVRDLEARFAKFAPRFEACTIQHSAGFTASSTMTFADIVLAEALSSYLEWCPEILSATPGLQTLYKRIVEHPGIAAYLSSPQRYPKPSGEYVIAVARVLRRALPPHMPGADRFVD